MSEGEREKENNVDCDFCSIFRNLDKSNDFLGI